MSSLLSAGIYRYRKSPAFWVMLTMSLILGLITGAITDSGTHLQIGYLFGIFLVIAIQISLIIGTEFGNGIVRNKLIIGHSKEAVFLSELLLSLISSTLLFVVYYGAFMAFNVSWFDNMEASDITLVIVGLWLIHLCFAAICTAVCFFIPYNTAVAVVLNLILVIAMAIGSENLHKRLTQPEYNHFYVIDSSEEEVDTDGDLNPKYIPPDSAKYAVLHTFYYLMPCGQLNDYGNALSEIWRNRPPNEEYLKDLKTAPLHSLVTIGLFTAAGLVCFRKKNLK